jgi:hypothetical protein
MAGEIGFQKLLIWMLDTHRNDLYQKYSIEVIKMLNRQKYKRYLLQTKYVGV